MHLRWSGRGTSQNGQTYKSVEPVAPKTGKCSTMSGYKSPAVPKVLSERCTVAAMPDVVLHTT